MLGLGSSIFTNKRPTLRLLDTYTSDFTSGVDGWAAHDVQGTLTISYNQTIDSTNGWLKCAYDTNQTDLLSGIAKLNIVTPAIRIAGDYFTVSYKLYLENVSGEDWGGTDDVEHIFKYGGVGTGFLITAEQDTTVTKSNLKSAIQDDDYNDTGQFYFSVAGDKPSADAVFYIKDIILKVYRPEIIH